MCPDFLLVPLRRRGGRRLFKRVSRSVVSSRRSAFGQVAEFRINLLEKLGAVLFIPCKLFDLEHHQIEPHHATEEAACYITVRR
jgi:hypothetical protein